MRSGVLCVAVVLFGCILGIGQAQEKILYIFRGAPDAGGPTPFPLVADRRGNLYGVTSSGGEQNGGAIFELSANPDSTWSEAVLYSFCPDTQSCGTGADPIGVTIDEKGNLFGTTLIGGENPHAGTVFELSPPSVPGGVWTYTVIYNFCSNLCLDGAHPEAPPTLDSFGNLYGTTFEGGTSDQGTVYELSPGPNGWTETVIYSFCSVGNSCDDGAFPKTGVVFDKAGHLYGTTFDGGTGKHDHLGNTGGTLYELSPSPDGWAEKVVINFPHVRGVASQPFLGSASVDSLGDVYTTFGATETLTEFDGIVTRTKPSGGTQVFYFDNANGSTPLNGVLVDPKRHLVYGTVASVGTNYCGGVFQISGSGLESVIYTFCQNPDDGNSPGPLIEDSSGNLYGMAYGGANLWGLVFEIAP